MKKRFCLSCLWLTLGVFLFHGVSLTAEEASPFRIDRDSATETYTILEGGKPVLSYHFGEVPFPEGADPPKSKKGPTDFNGSSITDGKPYGTARSDYVQPLYGFSGEQLTDDYPKDHRHYRGFWWAWCEVRWNEKIGDSWAVARVRSWPTGSVEMETDNDEAELKAVNFWRYESDPTNLVRETMELSVSKTTGKPGEMSRYIDLELTLEALVDGISFTGRQNVSYGGYGGIALRMNKDVVDLTARTVHPNPDKWTKAEFKDTERLIAQKEFGSANWLSIVGRYPLPGDKGISPDFTSVTMFESSENSMYPNNFRFYNSKNFMIAWPGFNYVYLKKGEPVTFKSRLWIHQGKADPQTELKQWNSYQKSF